MSFSKLVGICLVSLLIVSVLSLPLNDAKKPLSKRSARKKRIDFTNNNFGANGVTITNNNNIPSNGRTTFINNNNAGGFGNVFTNNNFPPMNTFNNNNGFGSGGVIINNNNNDFGLLMSLLPQGSQIVVNNGQPAVFLSSIHDRQIVVEIQNRINKVFPNVRIPIGFMFDSNSPLPEQGQRAIEGQVPPVQQEPNVPVVPLLKSKSALKSA